ncbi:hypothetical protein [Methanobacterium sp. ACI-7]|uniref:hypothetical protein n=1 Tax=unclassified Methanobacterium TaxID=2627676 RepID=UPI0039C12327
MKIERYINQFLDGKGKDKGRKPDERYASFDYCYNYFYSFYKQNKLHELSDDENLQNSCLHLGFYLASWGMMRGSSFLLQKSVKNYKNLIEVISKADPRLWEIDVDNYNEKNIKLLLNCKEEINKAFGKDTPTDTLITKIMLGVFANVPAFDQYVQKSLKVYKLNEKSLWKIKEFYDQNKTVIDSFNIPTYDFLNGEETDILYTKAKLVDMCGFMEGQE